MCIIYMIYIYRWYLGIQSKKDPAHVMNEVYKAMQALRCVWHQVNNYRVLCLWKYISGNVPKAHPISPTLSAIAAAYETGEDSGRSNKLFAHTKLSLHSNVSTYNTVQYSRVHHIHIYVYITDRINIYVYY